MGNNMTEISLKMYSRATSGQLTVREAADFLEKEMKMRTLREKFEKFFHGQNLKETLVQGMLRNHLDRDGDFAEWRVNDWLNNPANQTLEKGEAIEQCFVLGLSAEEADARILGKYFNEIIAPELTAMEQSNSEGERQNYVVYMKTYALAAGQNEITQEAAGDMESYREERQTALGLLQNSEMMHAFETSKAEDGKENGYG